VPDLRKTLVTYQLEVNKISEYSRELTISLSEGYVNEEGEKDIRFRTINTIRKMPLSKLPWDGFFLPKFKFDIDLTDAFDELGEYNSVEILKKGPDIIKNLRKKKKEEPEEEEEEEPKRPRSEIYKEVKELYMTLEASGMFKTRTDLLIHIGNTYGKTMQWAYNIVRGLAFDKSKFDSSVGAKP
jgi:hypothetical protein